jgi:hypothetical protein
MWCSPGLLLLLLTVHTPQHAYAAGPGVHAADYYLVLGISRTATTKQVQKAYRHLAMQYHPDKNFDPGAENAFRRIAEAYEVLCDQTLRRDYDSFGKKETDQGGDGGFDHWAPPQFASAFETFQSAFGGKDPFENFEEFFGADGFEEETMAYDEQQADCVDARQPAAFSEELGRNIACWELGEFDCNYLDIAKVCKKTCGLCEGATHGYMGAKINQDGTIDASTAPGAGFSATLTGGTDWEVHETHEVTAEDGVKVTRTMRKDANGRTTATIEEKGVRRPALSCMLDLVRFSRSQPCVACIPRLIISVRRAPLT